MKKATFIGSPFLCARSFPTLRVGTPPVTLRVTLAQGLDVALAHFQNLEAQMLVIAYRLGPHHLCIGLKAFEGSVF